ARQDLDQDLASLLPEVRAFMAEIFDALRKGPYGDELIGAFLPAVDSQAGQRIARFVNRVIEG
ncbi:MAG: hypothetical protein ACI8W8_002728, partial [Rhodothermales bacterium]